MQRIASRIARCLIAVAIVSSVLVPAGEASAAGCTVRPTGGLVDRHAGLDAYSIAVPSGTRPGVRLPLALMFPGLGMGGQAFAGRTGWVPFAAREGLIVAFPTALARNWLHTRGSPDVAAARRVVADIKAHDCVDARRVYAGGVSTGGYFAGRLACDAPDVFAAVAVVGAGDPSALGGGACTPSQSSAVSFFQGGQDRFTPMSWAEQSREKWIDRMSCNHTPKAERNRFGPLEHFGGCNGGVEVLWKVYNDMEHSWPKGELRDDALNVMWRFFSKYKN